MIVRALDVNNDWTFGQGRNNYLSRVDAVAQSIKTRLSSFLGDCFFDTYAGIDWFNFLGSKNVLGLRLAIATVILNTDNVTGIIELNVTLNAQRLLTVHYTVSTNFQEAVTTTVAISGTINYLTTEDGSIITTEDGSGITI